MGLAGRVDPPVQTSRKKRYSKAPSESAVSLFTISELTNHATICDLYHELLKSY